LSVAKKLNTCYNDNLILANPPIEKEEDEGKKHFNLSRKYINKIFFLKL